jgi:hypothetical protein
VDLYEEEKINYRQWKWIAWEVQKLEREMTRNEEIR